MNEQEQKVQVTPYKSPMYNYGSSIVALTNPKSLLMELEFKYKGLKDVDGEPQKTGKPWMNEKGINSVMSQIESIVNQVTIMGNLKDEEIRAMIVFLGETLAKDLMVNKENYDIKDIATRDTIYFTAISTAFITMKRAFKEGDRRFWKGSVQEFKTTVDNQKKPGLLGRFWK